MSQDDQPKYRTWSEFKERRIPTDYEQVTHMGLYHVGERTDAEGARFEVSPDDPMVEWFTKYRDNSVIRAEDPADWEEFRDPYELTYRGYNELQDQREAFIDTLFEQADILGRETESDDEWLDFLLTAVLPFRYPANGFQMLAAYQGMMAPSGYILNCINFQGSDELRRLERLASYAKRLEIQYPDHGFTEKEGEIWNDEPLWQPLREALELLLVEYDWGKSFVGTNLVLKPLVDEVFLAKYAELFDINDADLLSEMFENLYLDSDRSRGWSTALAEHMIEIREENQDAIQEAIDEWYPVAYQAAEGFRPAFEEYPPETMEFDPVFDDVLENHQAMLSDLPLSVPDID